VVVLLVFGPRLRGTPGERRLCLALAVANLVFGTLSTVAGMVPFNIKTSLPLIICGFAWVIVAWALLTRKPLLNALTYYWGLTLATQAMVQPSLKQAFPQPEYFWFFGKHIAIIWGAVFLTLVLRYGPDWRGYRFAVALTTGWLIALMCLNPLLGSNYGYFTRKPSQNTVLNLFGPWPLYVVVEALLTIVVWALITLPWTGLPRRRRTRVAERRVT
jgi:hypothetical integral membrane protein (TIGR02206 family)